MLGGAEDMSLQVLSHHLSQYIVWITQEAQIANIYFFWAFHILFPNLHSTADAVPLHQERNTGAPEH